MTPMLLLWIAAALAVGFGVGMVVGMRIRSNRVLDAQMARELARPAMPSAWFAERVTARGDRRLNRRSRGRGGREQA